MFLFEGNGKKRGTVNRYYLIVMILMVFFASSSQLIRQKMKARQKQGVEMFGDKRIHSS
jgi:hypothetical protein